MNEEILLNYIRPVTDEDREKLPRFSHSKLEQFKNCPMAYDFKYNQKMTTSDTTIALELGSLCHLVLELKGKMLQKNGEVDYEALDKILNNGYTEVNEKTKETILGLNSLKKKYWEEWGKKDTEGRSYVDKMQIFQSIMLEEMEHMGDWKPWLFEYHFEYVWDNRVIINGFIDRVDVDSAGNIRTIDYKTSKKPFPSDHLPTSQQFAIYACALLLETGKLPIESIYRFILIDQRQMALTKGWEKRFIKMMNGTLDKIEDNEKKGLWAPKPCPLCRWCNFSATNPDAHQYRDVCEYYSLWTPEQKSFNVNKRFDALETTRPNTTASDKPKRKIVF